MNDLLIPNGGFPPLFLKNNKKSKNNKERFINSNINIHQILKTKDTKNILDEVKEKNDLEVITSL